jgi:predicted secreted protein
MASLAKSLKLEYSSNDSSYTDVGELASVSEPGQFTAPDIDVTPVDTTGTVRTFLAGMKTGGTFTFSIYWAKANQTSLDTIVTASTNYYWKLTLPDTSTYKFQGILKSAVLGGVSNPDDILTITGTVVVNSAITYAAAA